MTATLYFDLGSPYVYLAVERLARFDFGEVAWRPVSLGALFKHTSLEPFVRAALRVAFVDGADLGGAQGVSDAARRVSLDPAEVAARIHQPWVKERLREYTDDALAAGVTGVPTLRVGKRLFWGDDQLEIAAGN